MAVACGSPPQESPLPRGEGQVRLGNTDSGVFTGGERAKYPFILSLSKDATHPFPQPSLPALPWSYPLIPDY